MNTFKIFLLIILFMMLMPNISNAQHLSSARGIGIGAFTSLTDDVNSLDWNPAGLINIKDWDISLSTYIGLTQSQSNFTLQSFGAGKKFLEKHSAALRYSPGSILEFILPTTFTIFDSSGNIITTKFDKKITFYRNYTIGYAHQITDEIAIGFSGQFFETKVSDNKYIYENEVIQSNIVDYTGDLWTFDAGALYIPNNHWRFGFVFKNLFKVREEDLSTDVSEFQLNIAKVVRLGVAYGGFENLLISVEGDNKINLRTGTEWKIFDWLKLRGGLYTTDISKFQFEAGAFGFGVQYDFLQFDLSYLKFFSNTNRTGVSNIDIFKNASYTDLDYTPFTTDRITFSLNISLGRTKALLSRIEYVEMLSEVYPASYQIYAFRPIGKARIKNISSKNIDAKVSFFVNNVMDVPTETKPHTLSPNETAEIPFFAVFNNVINSIKKFSIFDGTVYVNAEPTVNYDDRYQTRVLIRGRNDWNGDVIMLQYFITPSDPDVLKFSRKILDKYKDDFESSDISLRTFKQAQLIFNELSQHIQYIQDPKQSQDYVQYPAETISLRGGDCDDLTVCYSTMLASVGISSAFIDVIPPNDPGKSHIYLMFDTGIEAKNSNIISENTKRFILRKNENGIQTVWIPIETTVTSKGFTEAWNIGSAEYFQDVIINNGMAKGWVRVVDIPLSY